MEHKKLQVYKNNTGLEQHEGEKNRFAFLTEL